MTNDNKLHRSANTVSPKEQAQTPPKVEAKEQAPVPPKVGAKEQVPEPPKVGAKEQEPKPPKVEVKEQAPKPPKVETKEQAPKRVRIRMIPIWLRLIIVGVFLLLSVVFGLMFGYSVLGDGKAIDALKWDTWQHIIDIMRGVE